LAASYPKAIANGKRPFKTDKLPSGSEWLHEIKHDGFRVIARKNGAQVRLYSRPGNDLTYRFPLIVETLARLRSRSCIIDGEAVACDGNGVTGARGATSLSNPRTTLQALDEGSRAARATPSDERRRR
jgi:ATP-dependent DNA ligase